MVETLSKADEVVRSLRRRIVLGEFRSGNVLPTRETLKRDFGVSNSTVQQALSTLKDEGFIFSRQGSGSFVADNLPHLTNYAIAFPCPRGDPDYWSRFSVALLNEAAMLESRQTQYRLPIYHNVDRELGSPERRALEDEVRNHRLAGVILARRPFGLDGSSILLDPMVRRVCYTSQISENLPAVFVDYQSFANQALDELKRRGRTRIAIISDARAITTTTDFLVNGLAERGMTTQPWWVHKTAAHPMDASRTLTHLLMRDNPADRPDGIVITDDNLIEGVSAGLIAANIRVPTDVDVVAHANFPLPSPTVLPVISLGFSATEILETCLKVIDAQREGKDVPSLTLVPARFEEKLTASS